MADRFARRDGQFWGRVATIAFAAAFIFLGLPAEGHAESGSVRYDYVQVEIGERPQWVLVPRPADDLSGKATPQKIRTAFELLVEDKPNTYGDTSLDITGGSVEEAKVVVNIDPDYSKYKLIIIAETVYTLTELGVPEIRFPDFLEGNVGRKDVPFSAYTVTLPLWRAVPPDHFVDARIRLPDGKILAAEEFRLRCQQDDAEMQVALYSYLNDEQVYTVVSVLKRLPKLEVAYADKVVPLLKHSSKSVRTTALKVLAEKRNQQEVLEAVVALMQREKNEKLATKAAEFLGKADSDKYNVFKHFYYLSNGEKKAKVRAAKKLADKTGDNRVVEHLAEAMRTKAKKVASAAATSLLTLEAFGELREGLKDEGIPAPVRMEIAGGLSESSDTASQVAGYAYIGRNAEGRDARVAVRALEGVGGAEARETIESFLTDDDRRVRLTAASTLESIASTESLSAIADAVRAGDNAATIEDTGYRILKEQSLQKILEFSRSSDSVVQRIAYRALGPKAASGAGGDQVFERLKQGADHSDSTIRGAAARALGAYANDKALAVLKKLAADSSATVRRDVAYALGNYKKGEMVHKFTSYLDSDAPEVVAAALSSLAERKEAHAWDKIKKLAESDAAIVRKNALLALSKLVSRDDTESSNEVMGILSGAVTSDKSDAVVRTALEQLGTFESERAVNGIAIMLNAKEKEMRLTAIKALANCGHKSAIDLITDVLGDPNSEIRRAAVEALGELGFARAKPKLKARLQEEKDAEIKTLIKETLQKL